MLNKSLSFQDLRLLVVDDDPDTLMLLTTLFQLEGALVLAATSTAEALEAMSKFQPQVLISDICLPDEDGYSLLQKVRNLGNEQLAGIPAIAVTASTGLEERARAFSVGFQAHLLKPMHLDELVTVVANLVTLRDCLKGSSQADRDY